MKKSEQAARKELEAQNSRQTAKQYRDMSDFDSSKFYYMQARELEAETKALLLPEHPVVVGTGGEAHPEKPENNMIDSLLNDPTSVSLDASEQRLKLIEKLDIVASALDASETIGARNSLEKNLAHEMAVAHVAAMQLMADAKEIRSESKSYTNEILALKKQNMARAFMDFNVRALEAIAKIRTGGRQNITVTHKNVNVTGGQNVIADQVTTGRGFTGGKV